MIKKWKTLNNKLDNTTTFRFWCSLEELDLEIAEYLVNKYVSDFGYKTKGLIKIKLEDDDMFYEIITTLPFSVFQENNDFFEFVAVSDKQVKGIKKNNNNYDKEKN